MAITWNRDATARAGLSEDDLLVLAGGPTRADVIAAWEANLPRPAVQPPPSRVLFTSTHIARYLAMHAELFRVRPES